MKTIIITLTLTFLSFTGFSQTVYSDDQVIKISSYISNLEKKDSILNIELEANKIKAEQEANALKSEKDALKAQYDELEKKYSELEKVAKGNLFSVEEEKFSDEFLTDKDKRNQYFKMIDFKTNDANFDEKALSSLDALALQMKANKKITFSIVGFTDNTGTDNTNTQLSKTRATAVKEYLVSKGVKSKNLKTDWFGAAKPIANNNSEEGKAKNRRVEIRVK